MIKVEFCFFAVFASKKKLTGTNSSPLPMIRQKERNIFSEYKQSRKIQIGNFYGDTDGFCVKHPKIYLTRGAFHRWGSELRCDEICAIMHNHFWLDNMGIRAQQCLCRKLKLICDKFFAITHKKCPKSRSTETGRNMNKLNYLTVKLIGFDTHLFVKVRRPGDSEVTFSVFE